MKRLGLVLTLTLFLIACATTHINQVQNKWGPPAKVEDRGDTIVYYYYFIKGRSTGYHPGSRGGIVFGRSTVGVVAVEIITDRSGNILKKRKYWKQPEVK